MDPMTIMAVMSAVNAVKSSKEADSNNFIGQANTMASPWTNVRAEKTAYSKAPEILTQAVGTGYAMNREMERDKLAKMGKTGEAKAMGSTMSNSPWSFGNLMMPENMFGAQGG